MSSVLNPVGRFAQKLAERRANARRDNIGAERALPKGTPLLFETLEPRLLLAADPLGITAGYAFNEISGTTAADASGHGLTGTLANGATFTTAGKNGNAVSLDGVNDYVNLGNPTALQFTGSMTVSAWVYASAFPVDDAAVVSKRAAGEVGFQLDITKDTGSRTIGLKLTDSTGGQMFRYGATTLQLNTWYYITGVYNAVNRSLDVYLNGALDNGTLQGTVTSSQQNSTANVTIGRRAGVTGFEFNGRIDNARIADHALTQDQIQTDMVTPLGPSGPDATAPTVSLTAPAENATIRGTVTVSASASDNVGVASVQFLLDGANLGTADSTSPYSVSWNTTTATNGTHRLQGRATDISGNTATTTDRFITVDNQAPTGTIVINSGATATNSRNATLTLSASDAFSPPVTQMRFSNTGTSFSTAEAYATTKTWTLTSGAGTKTVYVQFKDALGNWSAAAITDTIVLDTAAPTISARTATNITGNGATITWTTNEPATSQVLYGTSTTNVDLNLVTAHSVALTGLAPSTTYNYRVRSQDAAGNVTTSANSTFTTAAGADTQAPSGTVLINDGAAQTNSTTVTLALTASDPGPGASGVTQMRFSNTGSSYSPAEAFAQTKSWTLATGDGTKTVYVQFMDAAGNWSTAATDTIVLDSNTQTAGFQNDILATGFDLPTAMKFLPDGRMLVAEISGTIKILPPPYTTPDPTPFLQLDLNIPGYAGIQQGIMDVVLDPDFVHNRYYYVFYTNDVPNQDRLSRFTANATLNGTIAGSELILYQDPQTANTEHHGGAVNFGNDGKIYFTTGEHFNGDNSQLLTNPRGKIHRINPNGTVPTDNPFYDGAGPNWDSIWAIGLRNPYRAYYDAPTGRLFIGDVGGNDYSTAKEEINIGVRGANYGWPNVEGTSANPAYTNPIYSYAHNGRDASVTGGFVYHGSQFPSSYEGAYFFADYTQNWIRYLTFDASGNVTGVHNFEPSDGSVDGPYGDIVYLTQGPEGALYYIDLGYSDVGGTFGVSKIRRIQYLSESDLPPVVSASAAPTQGPTPLTVNFSSMGSSDPEGQLLTYSWTFGDGAAPSTEANPSHIYGQAGLYQASLRVSDGVNSALSPPIPISAGIKPVITTFATTPANNGLFRAGDVISYSAVATDVVGGITTPLPASAFTWNIDFLHAGHVHPGIVQTGVTGGTFTIPTSGHDFSGDTRYRITLTVTDSDGLQATQSSIVFPDKVDLTFDTAPGGLTLYLDGIAHTAPFVYDTLIGFNHTIEARDQTASTSTYTFASWSDGGAQQHTITVPTAAQSYTANYTVVTNPLPSGLAAGWSFNEASGTSATDSSGNNNTATLVNGVARTTGNYGGGLTFDGVNDYLTIPNSPSLNIAGSGLTLSMWIKPQALSGGDSVVLGKFWNATMTSPYYQYGLELSGGTGPTFYIGTTGGPLFASMGSALALDQWSHLAVVFDGSQVRYYLNGLLVTTASLPATITARSNPLRIGADNNTQQFFKGSLDEVRIYNRALTVQEVQTDMLGGHQA